MKKIFILVLLLAPFISGCSVTKAEPQDSVTLTASTDPYIDINLTAGAQIKPGKISIKLIDALDNRYEEDEDGKSVEGTFDYIDGRVEVTTPEGNLIGYTSDFSPIDYGKVDRFDSILMNDYSGNFRKYTIGEQVDTNIELKDGEKLTFTDTDYYPMHPFWFNKDTNVNYAEVQIISDGSGEYDDSWKVEKEGLETTKTIDINYNQEGSGPVLGVYGPSEDAYPEMYEVGKTIAPGYLKVTCNSSSLGKCAIDLDGTIDAIPSKDSTIPIGESYTFDVFFTNGDDILITPAPRFIDKPTEQNITIEMVEKP